MKSHTFATCYPKAFVLIVRKTREAITSSTALQLERNIIRDRARHVKHESQFVYRNGSIIKYLGMASQHDRERIRSIGTSGGCDFIFVEEANLLTEADFDELVGRLRGRAAGWRQIMLATNPDSPAHWIYQRLILGNQATVYRSYPRDNPHLPGDYEKNQLSILTGHRYQRMALGNWVTAEGVVHTNFDEDVNIIDPFEIPDDWKRIGSIDFGHESPSCAQWWAIEPGTKRMYMYREVYQSALLPQDLAEIIASYGERVSWYADHDATDRAILARAGVRTKAAKKAVDQGLNSMNYKLRKQADGKPLMMFFRDALVAEDSRLRARHVPTKTVDEIPGYVWDTRSDGSITDRPTKVNDHGCDAARYAAVAADSGYKFIAV